MTLCFAPAGTITASPSVTAYSLLSIIHLPFPLSKRKNWSFFSWVSIPISSLGFRLIKTSWLYFAVYKTFRKLLFCKVSFSTLVVNPFMMFIVYLLIIQDGGYINSEELLPGL